MPDLGREDEQARRRNPDRGDPATEPGDQGRPGGDLEPAGPDRVGTDQFPYQPPLIIAKVEAARRWRGMKVVELERRVGVPRYRVYNWLNRSGRPTSTQAMRLAQELEVELEYLIDDSAPLQEPPPRRQTGVESELTTLIRRVGLDPRDIEANLTVIQAIRSLDLSVDEAVRRLSVGGPALPRFQPVAVEFSPQTPDMAGEAGKHADAVAPRRRRCDQD